MGKYDRQKSNAVRQIKAKGQAVKWRKVTNTGDVDKPWKTTASVVEHDCSILLIPSINIGGNSSSKGSKGATQIKEGDVQTGQLRGLLHAVDFEPALSDVVLRPDGSTLTVSDFDFLAPDGDAIIYEVVFSK